MNDKINQQNTRQDSEELLVTSSTSSPSNTIETRIITVSSPSNSPTSSSAAAASSSRLGPLVIGGRSLTNLSSASGSRCIPLCPIVTSSTNTRSRNCTPVTEIDGDTNEIAERVTRAGKSFAAASSEKAFNETGNKRIPKTGRKSAMGGMPSQNEGDTCVVISTNNSASCLEQRTNEHNTRRNMLLTMRSGDSNNSMEGNVPTVNSAINVPSTPTTRSKRKLLNSDATATGERSTTAATNLGVGRGSINLNNSKNVGLDAKNHQSSATKKKSNASAAALSCSINSSSHHGTETSTTAASSSKPTKGGKNLAALKNSATEGGEDDNSKGSSSGGSNKKNCTNTSESTESHSDQSQDVNINSKLEETDEDKRKVEPIKINLTRDAAKAKIRIKSVAKQMPSVSSDSSEQLAIPKLTIKSSSLSSDSNSSSSSLSSDVTSEAKNSTDIPDGSKSSQSRPESPHIVPKLIIRASDCNSSSFSNSDSKHSTVPKLTIKMENSLGCLKEAAENDSSPSPSRSSSSSPGELRSSRTQSPPPPLPKLTIKTTGDTTESIISTLLPSGSSSSVTNSLSTCTATAQPTVPKLTIKTILISSSSSSATGNGNEQSIPKFTIKTAAPSVSSQLSPTPATSNTDEGSSISSVEGFRANSPIPKFTIKTVPESEANSSSQGVPRLKIRTKPEEDPSGNVGPLSPTVPKFTIKSVQESEQAIPKLTISVNDRVSETAGSSNPSNDAVQKLTVTRHSEQNESDTAVRKLTISLQESPRVVKPIDSELTSEKVDKLPKLTIKTISEQNCEGSSEKVVPKLTIKTKPTEEVETSEKSERIPKITIKSMPELISEPAEKIPKLTIKTLSADLDTEEKSDKIPKLTIKTVPAEHSDSLPSDKVDKIPRMTIKTDAGESDKVSKTGGASTSTKNMVVELASEVDGKEKVPKLTIKQLPDTAESQPSLDTTSSIIQESMGRIPKFTIKSVPESETRESIDLTHEEETKAQKVKVKNQCVAVAELESTTTDKVPKLTIRTKSSSTLESGEPVEKKPKLVVQQSSQSIDETDRIPKLTIKHISSNAEDSSSISPLSPTSTLSPKVPKIIINNHETTVKHLKRAGRRKKADEGGVDDDSRSNDSTSTLQQDTEIGKTHVQTRSSSRNSDKSMDSSSSNNSKKYTASKNVIAKVEDEHSSPADTNLMQNSETIVSDLKLNPELTINEVTDNRPQLKTPPQVNQENKCDNGKIEADKKPALDECGMNCNLELELERITSQSSNEVNVSADSNLDSNLEISADLSDAAINDLVDILNDDDLNEVNSVLEEECALDESKNIENKVVEEPKNSVDEESKPVSPNVVVKPEIVEETIQSEPEINSNIPDDIVSLGSEEDDIVDQLTELLNEAAEANEFVDQLLGEEMPESVSNTKDTLSKMEITCDSPEMTIAPDPVKESCFEKEEVITLIEPSSETCSSIEKESTQNGEVTLDIPPKIINQSKNTAVIEIFDESEDGARSVSDSTMEMKVDEVVANGAETSSSQMGSLLETALLGGSPNKDSIDSEINCLKPVEDSTSIDKDIEMILEDEVQIVSDDSKETISKAPPDNFESTEMNQETFTAFNSKINLTENLKNVKTRNKLKRRVVVEIERTLKKSKSNSSVETGKEEIKLSSQQIVENCISGTDTEKGITTETPKEIISNVIDLESLSSNGDEIFRTLTELKTVNSNTDDCSNDASLDKEEKSEEENSSGMLKGILTRMQAQDERMPMKVNHVKCNSKSERINMIETEIAVVQSTPQRINSLKSTQSILLVNEESVSGDCMVVEEDPLMILPETIHMNLVDDSSDQAESNLETPRESESNLATKRPRGRPRKDGRPAGSVRKGDKMKNELGLIRRRPRSSLLDDPDVVDREEGPRRSGSEKKKDSEGMDTIFTTPAPVSKVPMLESLIRTDPLPNTATDFSEMLSPKTPMKRGRGRAKGFRAGRASESKADAMNTMSLGEDLANGENSDSEDSGSRSRGRGRGRGRSLYLQRGRGRGRGRGGRGRGYARKTLLMERSKDGEFFTPDRKDFKYEERSSSLQVFEEDTRMSAESFMPRQIHEGSFNNNDENTQSSVMSSSSLLDGSSNTTILNSTTGEKREIKKRAKLEVFAPDGKTEYTVDMICEYDWPPPKGCCPARNRDTFMIQEQIAQYLGIKSFKRKYPDLPRRQIDMEERNYLQEKGFVTEKMCDLGITAVWASDVLDIMYTDFYEKYEEYKSYLREKHLRDIEAKQRAQAADAVDKSLQARERALESASKWNSSFNKSRVEERRLCLDLQNLVINLPAALGKKLSRPNNTDFRQPSHYPIALVPGQFSENCRVYSSEELRRYPINTILDPFDDRLRQYLKREESDVESEENSEVDGEGEETGSSSGSDSDSSSSSDSESESSSSSEDEDKPPDDSKNKCYVCHQSQNKNQKGFPELFIHCVTCRKQTHPSCIEMSGRMAMRVRNYNWQCAECKCCIKCKRKQDESKMLYCEQCDRGFHIYCIQIKNIPDGRWSCERCAICMRCGATKAEGNLPPPPPQPNQRSSRKRVKWVNDYRTDPITKLRDHISILCLPCSRLRIKSKSSASAASTAAASAAATAAASAAATAAASAAATAAASAAATAAASAASAAATASATATAAAAASATAATTAAATASATAAVTAAATAASTSAGAAAIAPSTITQ